MVASGGISDTLGVSASSVGFVSLGEFSPNIHFLTLSEASNSMKENSRRVHFRF